jgi:hypothetical protein
LSDTHCVTSEAITPQRSAVVGYRKCGILSSDLLVRCVVPERWLPDLARITSEITGLVE